MAHQLQCREAICYHGNMRELPMETKRVGTLNASRVHCLDPPRQGTSALKQSVTLVHWKLVESPPPSLPPSLPPSQFLVSKNNRSFDLPMILVLLTFSAPLQPAVCKGHLGSFPSCPNTSAAPAWPEPPWWPSHRY